MCLGIAMFINKCLRLIRKYFGFRQLMLFAVWSFKLRRFYPNSFHILDYMYGFFYNRGIAFKVNLERLPNMTF